MLNVVADLVRASLRRATRSVFDATGLPLVFGGVVARDPSGLPGLRLSDFSGSHRGLLDGVAVEPGLGLGGKAVAIGRSVVVEDYVSSGRIRHRYDYLIEAEGLHGMVATPVMVGRRPVAVLYGARRAQGQPGGRAIDAIAAEARAMEQDVSTELARLGIVDPWATTDPIDHLVREAVVTELRSLAASTGSAEVRRELFESIDRLTLRPADQLQLTPRELQVLGHVAMGRRNAEIAEDLDIQVNTVKSYLQSAMQKLGARSRFAAVLEARRHGVLP